ncbi:SWIM zinc finger family protein [Tahibacter harae]|uniref:SWIM zinc finger family protein n=1 Tax=Tahibacter harae TaxID=2963937 RepID=A0ABT1QNC3_9GAMM|nr:SWIM zinc finger family protein [Tahibacter harae]MCQ4164036.1 SWIM zinc finger family protein [Tahibacter harae]
MSTRRADLAELGVEALTALANPGFVKRAQKDIAEGRLPQIEVDAQATVHAQYEDGQRASLAVGKSLREALCTCPAAGLCRHRVTLVLAYQHWLAASAPAAETAPAAAETAWSPGEFDDAALAAALAPAMLEQAARQAAAAPVVRLAAWRPEAPAPVAHLPLCSVRFFSRRNLSHARCDCRLGGNCEHVALAVWAFRQAGGLADAVIELAPRNARTAALGLDAQELALVEDVYAFLARLWLDGSSQDWSGLEAAHAALLQRLAAQGWSWPAGCLAELRELIQDQADRSSRFDPLRLLQVLAETAARLAAATQAAAQAQPVLPASQILGVGVRGEVALDHLKLVSLGLQCWSDARSDGARILFADPDTLAVTVLERSWPRVDGQAPTPLLGRRVAGQNLRQLAAAQVVTRGARRRANGLVDISALARQTSVLPLSAQSWEGLAAPLRQPGGAALARHLRTAQPDFVRPRQAIAHVHVLPVAAVLDWGWDAAEQTLYARLLCADDAEQAEPGDEVQLALPYQTAAPSAVDALAALLADGDDPPRRIAATASLVQGEVRLMPLSLLTAQRAVVLQASPAAAQTLPGQPPAPPRGALQALLEKVREELVLWARQGLRQQPASALRRLRGLADELAVLGLENTARQLHTVLQHWREAASKQLPRQLTTLVLLLQGLLEEGDEAEPLPSQ